MAYDTNNGGGKGSPLNGFGSATNKVNQHFVSGLVLPFPKSDNLLCDLSQSRPVAVENNTLEIDEHSDNHLLFLAQRRGDNLTRLALALDSVGGATLPLLLNSNTELCVELNSGLSFTTALTQAGNFLSIRNFTLGGSASTIVRLAMGEEHFPPETDTIDGDFLSALAARHHLEPVLIQSLHEIRSNPELLHLLSRRRLGWLFDEICRMACVQIRGRFERLATIETIIFGTIGAVLGRAAIEPGFFQL